MFPNQMGMGVGMGMGSILPRGTRPVPSPLKAPALAPAQSADANTARGLAAQAEQENAQAGIGPKLASHGVLKLGGVSPACSIDPVEQAFNAYYTHLNKSGSMKRASMTSMDAGGVVSKAGVGGEKTVAGKDASWINTPKMPVQQGSVVKLAMMPAITPPPQQPSFNPATAISAPMPAPQAPVDPSSGQPAGGAPTQPGQSPPVDPATGQPMSIDPSTGQPQSAAAASDPGIDPATGQPMAPQQQPGMPMSQPVNPMAVKTMDDLFSDANQIDPGNEDMNFQVSANDRFGMSRFAMPVYKNVFGKTAGGEGMGLGSGNLKQILGHTGFSGASVPTPNVKMPPPPTPPKEPIIPPITPGFPTDGWQLQAQQALGPTKIAGIFWKDLPEPRGMSRFAMPVYKNVFGKTAWQDNKGDRTSATGESTNMGYQHKPDHYAKGPEAWDSIGEYLKKKPDRKPDPFGGQHKSAGLLWKDLPEPRPMVTYLDDGRDVSYGSRLQEPRWLSRHLLGQSPTADGRSVLPEVNKFISANGGTLVPNEEVSKQLHKALAARYPNRYTSTEVNQWPEDQKATARRQQELVASNSFKEQLKPQLDADTRFKTAALLDEAKRQGVWPPPASTGQNVKQPKIQTGSNMNTQQLGNMNKAGNYMSTLALQGATQPAMYGALAGAGLGGLYGGLKSQDPSESRFGSIARGIGIGGLAGGALGGGIGAARGAYQGHRIDKLVAAVHADDLNRLNRKPDPPMQTLEQELEEQRQKIRKEYGSFLDGPSPDDLKFKENQRKADEIFKRHGLAPTTKHSSDILLQKTAGEVLHKAMLNIMVKRALDSQQLQHALRRIQSQHTIRKYLPDKDSAPSGDSENDTSSN